MNESYGDSRAVGCLGAIVGWLILGALTSVTFRLLLPHSFDPRDSVMVFYFKVVEGGVLGAATALALTRSLKRQREAAAKLCLVCGGLVSGFWVIMALFGQTGGSTPQENFTILVSWGGATFLWSIAVLIAGVVLSRK